MNMTDILLKIKDLHASVGDKEILKGLGKVPCPLS